MSSSWNQMVKIVDLEVIIIYSHRIVYEAKIMTDYPTLMNDYAIYPMDVYIFALYGINWEKFGSSVLCKVPFNDLFGQEGHDTMRSK